jgi:peptide/nickel transport system permease protein
MTVNMGNETPVTEGMEPKTTHTSLGKTMWREIKHDKMALFSLILLTAIFLTIYVGSLFLDLKVITKIDIFNIYAAPSAANWLGTDYGGRDVFGTLIIGAKNSVTIGIIITIITGIIGLTIGLTAGYFGGVVDNVIMRIIDFVIILPMLMIIIVLITVVPVFNVYTFIAILSIFLWTGKARLIRSKTLAERELDYVNASKTLGTPNWKIIMFEVLPNLSSIIIVNMTLTLAGNIGIETGLTFLGFGLPESVPSLGTLVAYASNPEVIQNKWWVWLPASLLILVIMLCINFIGQALKRAADARQRLT